MRNIVNGILNKNGSFPSTARPIATQPSGQENDQTAVPLNLKRPNYQRDKMKQRLSPIINRMGSSQMQAAKTNEPGTPKTPPVSIQHKPNRVENPVPGVYVENALSPLQRLSLFQVIGQETPSSLSQQEQAQFIGKTRDGSYVWFYPKLDPSLATYLQVAGKENEAVGIVAASRFSSGQLFLIDEVMKEFPQLAYNTDACKTEEFPFVFRVTGHNPAEIQKLVKEIYLRLNRRVVHGVTSYFTAQPTRFLVQHLQLQNQEAVAVLDGINTFHGVGLLDRLLKQKRLASLRFRVESSYLLIQGEQELVRNTMAALKQEADRLPLD